MFYDLGKDHYKCKTVYQMYTDVMRHDLYIKIT